MPVQKQAYHRTVAAFVKGKDTAERAAKKIRQAVNTLMYRITDMSEIEASRIVRAHGTHLSRSRYSPHQSTRELSRRRQQMASYKLSPFNTGIGKNTGE